MTNTRASYFAIILLILTIYINCYDVKAYDPPPAPELDISVNSSKEAYYRDEIIDVNYTIMNRYGRSQDFYDEGRYVIIKLPKNLTFKSVCVTNQMHEAVNPSIFSNYVEIRLPFSRNDWFASYVNMSLNYNVSSPPIKVDFLKDEECIDLSFTPYRFYKPEHYNRSILNRPPVFLSCTKYIDKYDNKCIYSCNYNDPDSRKLTLYIYNRDNKELENYTIVGNSTINTTAALGENTYYAILSDGFNSSEKVRIKEEGNLLNYLNPMLNFFIFLIIFLIVSYFIKPEISYIFLLINKNNSNLSNGQKLSFLVSDLWMFSFAGIFALGLFNPQFIGDIAIVFSIFTLILSIAGFLKEEIEPIKSWCIIVFLLFAIMLILALYVHGFFFKLVIFLIMPFIIKTYYKRRIK